ncbi:YncE family protein [Occallatibacter riparius]|uniref:YncE family protein n=1 Tax=Occallatibacter riparius TaxID=1002689 RepID=A0A9J7BK06_9BACT|nr:YncE family protein [Occallatibacter riparius]UWZ83160.1 YncE family protein [Occallatibacter riparius]
MKLFSSRFNQAHARLVKASAIVVSGAVLAGCGAGYRPVITPINPSGPPPQPSSQVAVVSSTGLTTPGVATIIDYAGDTIMATAPIGPGPQSFTIDQTGSNGYTVNTDGTLTNFPVSTNLQQKLVQYSTLPSTAKIVNLFSPSTGLWATDLTGNVVDVLNGFPATFKLAIPVSSTPVTVVGPAILGQRDYAIAQGFSDLSTVACNLSPRTVAATGHADAMETSTFTVSASIPVGKCPVYAVQSTDSRRLFVLNRGDDTITVINSQNNTLDQCTPFVSQSGRLVTCHPSLPLSTSAGLTGANVPAVAGPVYAEYNAATNQIVVANYDGGTVSVIDVGLDEYGNDGPNFGTTFTIPVGTNPASVTVLNDGSRAYTANQADGTVSVVNLTSHTLTKTLAVHGHPRTVVSTQNSINGKVYVSSPDSPYLTILRVDQDIIDATVLVQGNIVDVRTSTQDGNRGNSVVVSRKPGFGEPCNLPPNVLTPTAANCSLMP